MKYDCLHFVCLLDKKVAEMNSMKDTEIMTRLFILKPCELSLGRAHVCYIIII